MEEIIRATVNVLVMAAFAWLVKLLFDFVTAKINAVRADERVKENELVKVGLDIAEAAVKAITEATVGKLEELIAKELRRKVKAGEADASELEALAKIAFDEIIGMINPTLLRKLSDSMDADLYIQNQIELQLGLLKAKLNGQAA